MCLMCPYTANNSPSPGTEFSLHINGLILTPGASVLGVMANERFMCGEKARPRTPRPHLPPGPFFLHHTLDNRSLRIIISIRRRPQKSQLLSRYRLRIPQNPRSFFTASWHPCRSQRWVPLVVSLIYPTQNFCGRGDARLSYMVLVTCKRATIWTRSCHLDNLTARWTCVCSLSGAVHVRLYLRFADFQLWFPRLTRTYTLPLPPLVPAFTRGHIDLTSRRHYLMCHPAAAARADLHPATAYMLLSERFSACRALSSTIHAASASLRDSETPPPVLLVIIISDSAHISAPFPLTTCSKLGKTRHSNCRVTTRDPHAPPHCEALHGR